MPDMSFDIKRPKKTCVAYAQKISVLWPLMGKKSLSDSSVTGDVKKLQKRWRKRLTQLKTKGWPEVQSPGKLQFVRNCPLAGIAAVSKKSYRCCKLSGICPWCYMRQVAQVFNKVADMLPERGGLKDACVTLLEVKSTMLLRIADAGKFLSGHLLEWQRVPQKLLRKLKPLGSYRAITLDPKVVDGHYSAWRFTYRLLCVVPAKYEIPTWLDNGHRKVRLTCVKSKKQLINVISRICRYPVGLMRGDARMAMISLNAKRGKRCSEYTGCLRSSDGRSN